jgi:hypothetical protein
MNTDQLQTEPAIQPSEFTLQCEDCTRFISVFEANFYYQQVLCSKCLEQKKVILVKPQPKGVRLNGWDI